MKPIFEIPHGSFMVFNQKRLGMITVQNDFWNQKPLYVRMGKRSFTVSDRKPAAYGKKR